MVEGSRIPRVKHGMSRDEHLNGCLSLLSKGFETAQRQAQLANSLGLEISVAGMRAAGENDSEFLRHFCDAKTHAIRTAQPEIVYHIEFLDIFRRDIRTLYPEANLDLT
ncbi:MAG: hypothetical protein RBR86_00555 [Pseudobdellovibrionaceae bacterium]|nr:hypothetical protein [Pseudobdellovibrionaceae bacterium]